MSRVILHCDMNSFYASVELLTLPQLRQLPVAVCGDPDSRHGIILAKNELAKHCGVATAETIWQARKKCPELVLVPPHREDYLRFSRMVNQIYLEYTDMVEPFGIDESWLDVTGSLRLFGDGPQIADTLRRRVREETGLTISVGVSFNKVFAKLGSDYKKPDATTVISPEGFRQIVFPLPVQSLLYVGKSVLQTLSRMEVATIGDLAACDRRQLSGALGKLGDTLWEYANGLDESPVRRFDDHPPVKSVSNHMTFRRNLVGWEDIKTGVTALADNVAMRLRKQGLKCCGVQVLIKNPSLKSISRQKQCDNPTDLARDIARCAMELIRASWEEDRPIRMLSVGAIHLTGAEGGFQTSLFQPQEDRRHQKQEKLEQAMDHIRAKYGKGAVQQAVILQNDIGVGAKPQKQPDKPKP